MGVATGGIISVIDRHTGSSNMRVGILSAKPAALHNVKARREGCCTVFDRNSTTVNSGAQSIRTAGPGRIDDVTRVIASRRHARSGEISQRITHLGNARAGRVGIQGAGKTIVANNIDFAGRQGWCPDPDQRGGIIGVYVDSARADETWRTVHMDGVASGGIHHVDAVPGGVQGGGRTRRNQSIRVTEYGGKELRYRLIDPGGYPICGRLHAGGSWWNTDAGLHGHILP